MSKIAKTIVATIFSSAMVVNGFAASNLSKFACAAGPIASTGMVGKIIQSSGDVLYSGATGYTDAEVGAKLVSGAQISTGENSSARIAVGSNCNLPIGANSIATLTQKNGSGNILVSISSSLDTTSGLVQEGSSTQEGGSAAGYWIFVAGIGLVAGTFVFVSIGDEPGTPDG